MTTLIRVQLRGATNTKPARFHVSDGKHTMYVKYRYESDEQERFEAAQAFCKRYLPFAPNLYPIPDHFRNDSYYRFLPKIDYGYVEQQATIMINNIGLEAETQLLQLVIKAVVFGVENPC